MSGGPGGIPTHDKSVSSRLLYALRYRPGKQSTTAQAAMLLRDNGLGLPVCAHIAGAALSGVGCISSHQPIISDKIPIATLDLSFVAALALLLSALMSATVVSIWEVLMNPNENVSQVAPAKTPRHRSPNYPGVSLKTAVDKISDWYKKDGLVASPRDAAMAHMGFEKFTGDAGRLLSALKSFGLVQEADNRLKLMPRGVEIVARQEGDAKRVKAIQDAAKAPAIYAKLLKAYASGLPSDPTLKSELIAGEGFNPKAVDEFIRDFRATLKYGGISDSKVLESLNQDDDENPIEVGSYVQWESQGVVQFPEPKRVTGLSDDGSHAFVEGSGTGLPVEQLTVVEAPTTTPRDPIPPKAPPLPIKQSAGVRQDLFSLSEGTVSIQWPASLSPESYQDLAAWLDILKRKIGRSVEFRPTKNGIVGKLMSGFRIHGDPESDVPCSLLSGNQNEVDSVILFPAELLRELISEGFVVAANPGARGKRFFGLST
jgi:hypothetical protein